MLHKVAWSVADASMRMSHLDKIHDASPWFQFEKNDSGAVTQLQRYAVRGVLPTTRDPYVAGKHKRVIASNPNQ